MNNFSLEIAGVLNTARGKGLAAEIYLSAATATTIRVQDGEVDQFTLAETRGAGLRVLREGRVGYAFTEDLSSEALERTLDMAATNATLVPEREGAAFGAFTEPAAELALFHPELADVPVPEKIALAKAVERIAKGADERIKNVTGTAYSDSHGFVRVASTEGVDRHYRSSIAWVSTVPLLHAQDQHKNYYQVKASRQIADLEPEAIAKQAVERAARKLGAVEPKSGHYPVLIAPEAMADLLGVFSGIFSGKAAQEGKSLLRDRLGETIASPAVTLIDDALQTEGFGARPFDDEGCPSRALPLVEGGVFKAFLHNSETACKAKTMSTGHGSRSGYRGTLEVTPANLYLKPGDKDPLDLVVSFKEAVMVSEVTGLHAGANAISGDFSLQAQGYWLQDGQVDHPIHNFTVSGNFYDLLAEVSEVANDLEWFTSCIGSPSVLIRELAIAGC